MLHLDRRPSAMILVMLSTASMKVSKREELDARSVGSPTSVLANEPTPFSVCTNPLVCNF